MRVLRRAAPRAAPARPQEAAPHAALSPARRWFSYLDFMRYAWGGLMVNQFSGERHGDPMWLSGETVLEHYQLKNYSDRSSARYTWYNKDVEMWANVGFLCIFFLGYFLCAWAGLKYAQHGAR